ncbi:MAG: OmpA family protein [bacterium]
MRAIAALGRSRWIVVLTLAMLAGICARPQPIAAQTVFNRGTATANGIALDSTRAVVSLKRESATVPSSIAEIAPASVVAGSRGVVFDLSIRPTIEAWSPGINRIEFEVPAGFDGVVVQSVSVGDTLLNYVESAPETGQYEVAITNTVVSLTFPTPVKTDQVLLGVRFSANAPATVGSYAFGAALVNRVGGLASIEGNSDGDSTDANSLGVRVVSAVDGENSSVTIAPAIVVADGQANGLLTATLRDAGNQPITGKTIVFISSRDTIDTITQPDRPTDATGAANAVVRSRTPGVATITARVVEDSVAVVQQAQVTFTQRASLELELSPSKDRVVVGDVVTYTAAIANPGAHAVTSVYIDAAIPPDFKYLRGSATLDGTPIADPAAERTMVFDVGAVPGLIDANGNGRVDAGETGYATLRYRLVVGAGATPGPYASSVVARDVCAECVISNTAEASVTVTADPLFSLGTIIGRVFEDADGDGRLGSGEDGVANAMVALDDGTYALTDARGLYHISTVRPGYRVVKINLGSLPGVASATTDEAQVVTVTSGLLAKANFGVTFERESVVVGQSPIVALDIETGEPEETVDVRGNVNGHVVAVNGEPVAVTTNGASATSATSAVASISVTFGTAEALLAPAAHATLDSLGEHLRAAPGATLLIEGHTDALGAASANIDLSRRRAEAVANYLVSSAHVAREQLELRWFGEERPAASNATAAGRALNRRADARILDRGIEAVDRAGIHRAGVQSAAASAIVNGAQVAVDSTGRFEARREISGAAAGAPPAIAVTMTDRTGGASEARASLPEVAILEPRVASTRSSVALEASRAEVASAGRELTAVASDAVAEHRLVGRTDPANTVELDGEPVAVRTDGTFTAELPLRLGANTFGVVVRDTLGMTRVVTLPVNVAAGGPDGALVATAGAVPVLSVSLPPKDAVLANGAYPVSGRTDPGNVVTVNGDPVTVESDGSFSTIAQLPGGRSRVVIESSDSTGRVSRVEREVEVDKDRFFLLALADGTVGNLEGRGFLDGAGAGAEKGLYAEGRIAYYLKGTVRGRYLITSAFDTGISEFSHFFDDVDEAANERLLTNIDPDRFYPVYGDSSTLVFDTPTRGRFYLAVEGDDLRATIGNAALALDGGELASFQRTLYGGQIHYQSRARTAYGEPATKAAFVQADVRQAHVRDELRGTGGSLYYLSQRDVIEGSEQIAIAVRDINTGLVHSRVPQRRNIDYTIKYLEGRIFFNRPVSSVSDSGAFISREALAGDPVVIEVDYETRVSAFDKSATGGRVQQHVGDNVAIGGTYVHDALSASEYDLRAADTELRFGKDSKIVGEFAASTGAGSRVFTSADGGLSFAEATPAGAIDGHAWKAAADIDVGALFGDAGRVRARGYYKRVDGEFVSSGNLGERGTEKAGLGASVDLARGGTLGLRYDGERQVDSVDVAGAGRRTSLASARWIRDAARWGLGTELQTRRRSDIDGRALDQSSLANASAWSRLTDKITGRVERQQTLEGSRNDLTSLGLQYKVNSLLALETKGTTGSVGSAIKGGATVTLGDASIYVSERVSDDRAGRGMTTVLGAQTALGPSSRVYSEYQWERVDTGARDVSLIGAEKGWEPTEGVQLHVSGEHGESDARVSARRHSALATSVTWVSPSGWRVTSRDELRFDTGSKKTVQTLTSNQIEARLGSGFTALGRFRFSETRDRVLDRTEARFEEHGVGVAFRPEHDDRVNALARVTRVADKRARGLASDPVERTTMDVLSLEGAVDLNSRMQWSTKSAGRVMREELSDAVAVRTHSVLLVNRMNTVVRGPIGFGLEYRILTQREAADHRSGWLNELTYDASRHMRLGAGFNFTDFSDNEFSRNDYSVRGWFVRIHGNY